MKSEERAGDGMKYLICARADAKRTIPGSVFDKSCSRCGARVMIAPSGQRSLRTMAGLEVLCDVCFVPAPDDRFMSAGHPGELEEELQHVVPNPWRGRN